MPPSGVQGQLAWVERPLDPLCAAQQWLASVLDIVRAQAQLPFWMRFGARPSLEMRTQNGNEPQPVGSRTAKWIATQREIQGRRRWSREDEPFEIELAHRIWSNPGFRAIVRLTLTLERLDDTHDLQPEMIERMPITDFLFADAAYHYLQAVPITDPERATIGCASCQGRFLPVL